jgi:hypothetical protein
MENGSTPSLFVTIRLNLIVTGDILSAFLYLGKQYTIKYSYPAWADSISRALLKSVAE